MNKDSKILVLGASGLLGSSIVRILQKQKFNNIISHNSSKCNLLEKKDTENYIQIKKPEYIFMTAGLVGGINVNKKRQADFLYTNAIMILNILESMRKFSSNSKLLYTGSTCIYPKNSPQPIVEENLLNGKLEETNIGYAIAKTTGIYACKLYAQQYNLNCICANPTNLYGIQDNYNLETGHFIANLIAKFVHAKNKKTTICIILGDISGWTGSSH